MMIDMQEAIKNKTAHPDDTPADVKIAIKDLNLYYGAFHALHGINLDIERGKITAFIGPSGCGKSTLLKTLNRMNDLIDLTAASRAASRWTARTFTAAWT
mgnify:CR=1 FL=1